MNLGPRGTPAGVQNLSADARSVYDWEVANGTDPAKAFEDAAALDRKAGEIPDNVLDPGPNAAGNKLRPGPKRII